jgi:hypothetical protein
MQQRGGAGVVLGLVAAVVAGAVATRASGATVTYHGLLWEEGPVQGDFVVAGTFRPGFDVSRYSYTYGDRYGNLSSDHYPRAVADGNFRPIGPGTLAGPDGAFAGSGSATGIDGLPIFLFAGNQRDLESSFYIALATSSSPTWRVSNDADVTLDAAAANAFVFGRKLGDRIMLDVPPFPEPGGAAGAAAAGMILALRRPRRGGTEARRRGTRGTGVRASDGNGLAFATR